MVIENLFTALLGFTLLIASLQLGPMRPLDGEQWLAKHELLLQSLQKGPVTGTGHNPCTEIPGRETGICKLGGMNVAGNVMHAVPALTGVVPKFGVLASTAKETHHDS
ncbi:hypothetical protein ES332_A08G073100v1 [Gossypium tomentosum]|uniref:Uncharacterized protein n=1 Tax=Gossypium tomentosum TaxID=34277 RepID=A0A5D2PE89_GOSTO|nr:hypothetical protein ES332_A08G073100v1 [Gossypium tomentosum]